MNCFRIFDTADKPSAGDTGEAERCTWRLQRGQERSVCAFLNLVQWCYAR